MTQQHRPNIILIMTGQQRYDTIGALGYPYAATLHVDRPVSEGTAFTRCHITAASCVACRASLFTGYYPHTTGVLRSGRPWTAECRCAIMIQLEAPMWAPPT